MAREQVVYLLVGSTRRVVGDFTVSCERIFHGETNSVEHVPRGFLRDGDFTANFVGAHAVYAIHDQPHCGKPLFYAKRRTSRVVPVVEVNCLLAWFTMPAIALLEDATLSLPQRGT